MKNKENRNYENPNQTSAKKQAAGTLIGIVLGLVVFYVLFDVLGIGGSVIPKKDYSFSSSNNNYVSSVQFGEYDNDIYNSSYCHLSFTLPDENWTFKTAEEIQKIESDNNAQMNDSGKVYTENELEICYYDMLAFNEINASSVEVAIAEGKKEGYAEKSTSDLYLKSTCDTILASDEQAEISDVYGIVIGGETYRAIDVDYSVSDAVQTMAVKKAGNGFVIVLATRYGKMDDTDNKYYFDLFSKY